MSEPIVITPVVQPVIARTPITPEQVAELVTLIGGSNLITLPAGKAATDLVRFAVTILPNGTGVLELAIK